ncbi:hypothetical protein [Marinimicrobium sp. ABcell2]|uniref:hypothetical protein n=1 Tax=Marinimicrobium sp. ABcell2 TaxID=3069751 RepID=UPI0027B7E86A|nr:hypothetical protein [Marinimicrobium sp. ABcell2]MDQ2075316.1 hypothetical protein [Marinimicrobium sp. ABcell2]
MEMTNFDEWETDLELGQAIHYSGPSLRIEGDPKDPSAVTPINFSSLPIADQARLLREGLAALAAAARRAPDVKTSHQRAAEESARLFAQRQNRPVRPTLTLNR